MGSNTVIKEMSIFLDRKVHDEVYEILLGSGLEDNYKDTLPEALKGVGFDLTIDSDDGMINLYQGSFLEVFYNLREFLEKIIKLADEESEIIFFDDSDYDETTWIVTPTRVITNEEWIKEEFKKELEEENFIIPKNQLEEFLKKLGYSIKKESKI